MRQERCVWRGRTSRCDIIYPARRVCKVRALHREPGCHEVLSGASWQHWWENRLTRDAYIVGQDTSGPPEGASPCRLQTFPARLDDNTVGPRIGERRLPA